MSINLRFWGVRGSIATPGPHAARVGGNTSCVELSHRDERIVFDCGTGFRLLGDELISKGDTRLSVLISHLHWDHIQGIPFFPPLYQRSTELSFLGPRGTTLGLEEVLATQMSASVFPVRFDELPSKRCIRELKNGEQFSLGSAHVTTSKLNHPGGVFAYRVELGGRIIVYATDTEHYSAVDPALKHLARDADILIYDAQYTPEEYSGQHGPSKMGWGHSTFAAGAEVAKSAGVKQLVLFHHDPRRTDEQVSEIEERARKLFANTVAAREGCSLSLDAVASAA